jgi:hypothetical protein
MPTEKLEDGWMHAHRLPLGSGWSGTCTAPGHENEIPSHEEMRQLCNLGYAAQCDRLPRDRSWDSVRFGAKTARIRQDGQFGDWIQVRYVCEREHRPADHGILQFQTVESRWREKHSDLRVQRMAECFLESWLEKRKLRAAVAS